MSSTLAVFLMTLTAVMTLPVFDPATPKVSILSIGKNTLASANELVTEATKQTAEFQTAANNKATFMLSNYEKENGKDTVSSCPRTRQMLSSRSECLPACVRPLAWPMRTARENDTRRCASTRGILCDAPY